MIRPRHFGVNPQTAASNSFQQADSTGAELAARAAREVDDCAHALAAAGVTPLIFDDTDAPAKPDAVFPNNWVSFHASGRIVLYPMLAPNRRVERRPDILHALTARGYRWHETIDLSELERRGLALEGTGSLVFDRPRGFAFAALSSRTHRAALAEFAARTGYRVLEFHTAFRGQPVYHTNVMLALGRQFAVICDEIIPAPAERDAVIAQLEASGRDVIRIDAGQMACFAANLLELDAETGPVIALSTTALAGLRTAQRRRLEAHGRLLPVAVPAVESDGGSLRCMLAEVFLPRAGSAGG
ncbi:MAG: amidinotransferase [Chromatiales bacterium]|nr:MAG: amidinotransferase [Chromatiales bacterium]